MASISFDRVAHAYDETRGYPPGVARQIAAGLEQLAQATPETAFLEVGVGTGRIALPLASLGHTYTGVDISVKMLAQFEGKLLQSKWIEQHEPWGSQKYEVGQLGTVLRHFAQAEPPASMSLVESDITALPFADATFDVAVAVHIFHLVDGWEQAVREVLRVLRPGGMLLHCWDEHHDSILHTITNAWVQIIETLGGNVQRAGNEVPNKVSLWLHAQGLPVAESPLVSWETSSTPRADLERLTSRLWSRTWLVPDELFEASVPRLEAWVLDHFGAEQMDTPYTRKSRFMVHKTGIPTYS